MEGNLTHVKMGLGGRLDNLTGPYGVGVTVRVVGTIQGPLAGREAPEGGLGLIINRADSSGKGLPGCLRLQLPGEARWGLPHLRLPREARGAKIRGGGRGGEGGRVLRQGGVTKLIKASTPVLGGGEERAGATLVLPTSGLGMGT